MATLFQCDQCTYEEWRADDDEPYLCPVCGYMRWERIAHRPDPDDTRPVEDPTSENDG